MPLDHLDHAISGRHNKERHDKILVAVRMLQDILKDTNWADKPARTQIDEALNRVDVAGHRFWGFGELYSRRRSAADTILKLCYDHLVPN